eukprot:242605-Chlamydomonas_euryale.AAC.1
MSSVATSSPPTQSEVPATSPPHAVGSPDHVLSPHSRKSRPRPRPPHSRKSRQRPRPPHSRKSRPRPRPPHSRKSRHGAVCPLQRLVTPTAPPRPPGPWRPPSTPQTRAAPTAAAWRRRGRRRRSCQGCTESRGSGRLGRPGRARMRRCQCRQTPRGPCARPRGCRTPVQESVGCGKGVSRGCVPMHVPGVAVRPCGKVWVRARCESRCVSMRTIQGWSYACAGKCGVWHWSGRVCVPHARVPLVATSLQAGRCGGYGVGWSERPRLVTGRQGGRRKAGEECVGAGRRGLAGKGAGRQGAGRKGAGRKEGSRKGTGRKGASRQGG